MLVSKESSIIVKGIIGSITLDGVGHDPGFGMVHIMHGRKNNINILSMALVMDTMM